MVGKNHDIQAIKKLEENRVVSSKMILLAVQRYLEVEVTTTLRFSFIYRIKKDVNSTFNRKIKRTITLGFESQCG